MKFKFLAVLTFFSCSFTSLDACQCNGIWGYKESPVVFKGKVVDKETVIKKEMDEHEGDTTYFDYKMYKYSVAVLEVYKGLSDVKMVTIFSGAGIDDDCSLDCDTGKTYLLYATKDPTYPMRKFRTGTNIYYTSKCTKTKLYSEKEVMQIRKLK